MNNSRKPLLLIPVLIIALVVFFIYQAKQYGTVSMSFNVIRAAGTIVKFNGKTYSPTGGEFSYKLRSGIYTVTADDPGYKNFNTTFTLKSGQTIIINAAITLGYTPSLTSLNQVQDEGTSLLGSEITSVTYFYDNTWAFVNINTSGDQGVLVAEYSPVAKTWIGVVGPGTLFSSSSVSSLPSLVQGYLSTNGYINQGAAL